VLFVIAAYICILENKTKKNTEGMLLARAAGTRGGREDAASGVGQRG
jgi:hypothetical protein